MRNDAVIIGYSGHSYVVIDLLLSNNYTIKGYCEQILKINNPYEIDYLGNERDSEVLLQMRDYDVFIGIGDNYLRAQVFALISENELHAPTLVHPRAYISTLTEIGLGTVIMPGVVVNSNSKIGVGVICNSSSVIEHECRIENFVHIAPGAVLAANVSVGTKTFIGANSVIKQGVNIGSGVIIGAGSVVVKDIENGSIVYGNPARIK